MIFHFLAHLRLKVQKHTTLLFTLDRDRLRCANRYECKHILQWDSLNVINFVSFQNYLEVNNDTLKHENNSAGQCEIVLLDNNCNPDSRFFN